MTIPKSYIILFIVILIGVIVILSRGCKSDPAVAKVIDSLKWVIRTDSISGEAKYKSDSSLIHDLHIALDTTTTALQEARKQFNVQGKKILATNKTLRAAFIIHDTSAVYLNCDTLSRQIDSIAQQKWNVDRELDRQIVLNEQLHSADSVALANCRVTLKQTQTISSLMGQNYEIMLQASQQEIKKAKRKNKLWGIGGGVLGAAIRSIFK